MTCTANRISRGPHGVLQARGLDPSPTNFPAGVFDQSIAIAGIKLRPPPLVATYDYEPQSEEDEEAGLGAEPRNNDAYDLLQRFESQMRRFIDVNDGSLW